jgi:DNA replication and repair protein RecF
MNLKHLSLVNFKNYASIDLELGGNINCFVGNNGVGKTTVLDGIYYLSFCKSYFNPIDIQNVKFGEDFFVVQGSYFHDEQKMDVYCGLKKGSKKKFKWNKKDYSKLADHIGKLPLVIITPSDAQLISEGSDIRRKFVDGVISQYDHEYLEHLLNYNKALSHRNALLKLFFKQRRFDESSLEIWDEKLAQYGQVIHKKRNQFIEELTPYFNEYYQIISGGNEQVELKFQSQLFDHNLPELLKMSLDEDRFKTYTTKGIHKDDLSLLISGHPIKKFGSQGQQKSFLISLKLAQSDFMFNKKGYKPLLLLDDIFDKLDDLRVKKIIDLVGSDRFGQTFITDTSERRIKEAVTSFSDETQIFNLSEMVYG